MRLSRMPRGTPDPHTPYPRMDPLRPQVYGTLTMTSRTLERPQFEHPEVFRI